MKLHEIPTPALVVDARAMERNIQRMAAFFSERPCKLRPHFKAHKTPAIARRQLAAGSCTGVTCATVSEAEIVAAEGVSADILIANEVLGAGKGRARGEAGRQRRHQGRRRFRDGGIRAGGGGSRRRRRRSACSST